MSTKNDRPEINVDLLGSAILDPFRSSCFGGVRGAMFTGRASMAEPNNPTQIESSSAMLAEKHKIENWSEKRLVQTSTPYPSRFEALDACVGARSLDGCDYAYVDDDCRVVSIFRYYDVTPNQPVGRGQRRVIIPSVKHVPADEIGVVAERAGMSWSNGDEFVKVAKRIALAHSGAAFEAKTSAEPGKYKQFTLIVTIPE